jgi:hypothetical protein
MKVTLHATEGVHNWALWREYFPRDGAAAVPP